MENCFKYHVLKNKIKMFEKLINDKKSLKIILIKKTMGIKNVQKFGMGIWKDLWIYIKKLDLIYFFSKWGLSPIT